MLKTETETLKKKKLNTKTETKIIQMIQIFLSFILIFVSEDNSKI